MKTEDRKVKEARTAPVHSEVRKKHKPGRLGVDRVGNRRS